MKSNWENERPTDLNAFSGSLFDIPRTSLHEDIGLRCYFKAATIKTRFTIVDVQRTHDGTLAYRVVADNDIRKFGCPARPEQITFVSSDKTYKALFDIPGEPSFSFFDNLDDATDWILSQYTGAARMLKRTRKGEIKSFTGQGIDASGVERVIRANITRE